jgi:hypothetical protein
LRNPGDPAYCGTIHWRVPPAEHFHSLFTNDALQHSFTLQALMPLDRQECHANSILTGRWQIESEAGTLAREKPVWDLDEDSGAITGFRVAAAGAPMSQADEYPNSLFDDLVALVASDARNKAHAASVMLMPGIVQSLRMWHAWRARKLIRAVHSDASASSLVQSAYLKVQFRISIVPMKISAFTSHARRCRHKDF